MLGYFLLPGLYGDDDDKECEADIKSAFVCYILENSKAENARIYFFFCACFLRNNEITADAARPAQYITHS